VQLHSPAADRNRDPILAVLARVLPTSGVVLELASGTGQHAAHVAAALPGLTWQPSDPDAAARASIAASTAHLPNVRPPLALDALAPWPLDAPIVAMVAINLVHIAPWAVALAVFAGAGARLPLGGVLVLYGPYRIGGVTAPSNDAFDADLQRRNPAWGVRDLEALVDAAARHGLALAETLALPANNHALVFRKR